MRSWSSPYGAPDHTAQGAPVRRIIYLLSKEYIRWILLANLIAWPVAYFAMDKWLQNFEYHIDWNIWIFVLAGITALVVALMTVGYQTGKAAISNPVDTLRYE